MSIEIIGDRGDWKKIQQDSALIEKLNREAEREPGNPHTPKPQTNPQPDTTPQVQVSDMKGFIYVPSVRIYVAKNRDLNGLNWNDATDKIYNQGINISGQRAEMPTPFEFMSYLKYLLSGNIQGLPESERQDILCDILKKGNYKGNWLNARFVQGSGFNDVGIETIELDSSGNPIKKVAPLEQCLWQDVWADINSGNSQGLLKNPYGSSYEQGKNVYFWHPRENCVARFYAISVGAILCCDRVPSNRNASLGVRLVVRPKGAAEKNSNRANGL